MQGDTYPVEWYMSNGSDWLKVDILIQGPVAVDASRSGTIFHQSDARRHPVSWILVGQKSFYCAMYLLPLDLVSKNHLSTNQNSFNARAISDMYHSVRYVSPCIVRDRLAWGRESYRYIFSYVLCEQCGLLWLVVEKLQGTVNFLNIRTSQKML